MARSKALILGGAQSVWDDVRNLEELIGGPWPSLVIAVNDIGCHWSHRLDHWCTCHPEKLGNWKKERAQNGHPDGYLCWGNCRRLRRVLDRCIDGWRGGSSGFLAVGVAAELGCTHAILCGVPMQRTPHFAESTVHRHDRNWSSAATHWKRWDENQQQMLGWVRSMSGRTQDLLGAPDMRWLAFGGRQDDIIDSAA